VLLLHYGALVSLLGLQEPGQKWALLLFPMLSRWSMVVALAAFPYVRQQGLGSPFHQGRIWPATTAAAVSAAIAAVLLGGIAGAAMLVGATAIAWLLGWGMASKLGGLTGDTYGAVNEVIAALALLAAVAVLPYGWLETLPQLLGRWLLD
jgi:adenosylcobinamide-GDP ribazoletransferase